MSDEKSTDSHNKVVRLFTYLEKALALDDSIIRDFRNSVFEPSPWWVADYPTDLENLYIKKNETESSEQSMSQDGMILRVQKKDIETAPSLPDELKEWVVEVTPLTEPRAIDKIDRKTKFTSDTHRVEAYDRFKDNYDSNKKLPGILDGWVTLLPDQAPEPIKERYIEDPYNDHPELGGLLQKYIDNDWRPWSERTVKAYKVNLLYDQLYALRLALKNEGDKFELVYGQGLLTWKRKDGQSVYSPVFLTPLVLDFNAVTRTIQISQDSMLKNFVELSSLQELHNPSEMDLVTWADKINADPFDFWHYESLKMQTKFLINTLANDSEDNFTEDILSAPNTTETPSVWNSPVIFVRKRNNDLWSKYAGLIRRDIERNDIEPTDFIADLVGDYAVEEKPDENIEELTVNRNLKDSELFFPLPWNDEQKRIAERVESNYGVVVKGPPGTGKSHTIANLISRFLAEGKTVLVTSQTSKALDVLRDKLPENIRSLAVSQLQQSAKQDQVLQESIAEISSNLGERHTKFSEDRSNKVRNELHQLRQQKASLANKIREYILTDSQQSLQVDGETYTPITAAKLIAAHHHSEELAWFTDEVGQDDELVFSQENLRELYELAATLTQEDRSLYRLQLPDINKLPNSQIVGEAFSTYSDLLSKIEASNKVFNKDPNIESDELLEIQETLESARSILLSIDLDFEKELFDRCKTSESEKQKWFLVLKRIFLALQKIKDNEELLLGHEVNGSVDVLHERKTDAISILKNKTDNNTRISGVTKMLLPSHAKQVLNSYQVNGRPAETTDDFNLIQATVDIEIAQKEIKTLFDQSFSKLKSPAVHKDIEKDTLKLEVFLKELTRIVKYTENYSSIDKFCKSIKDLSTLSFTEIDDLNKMIELLSSYSATYQMKTMQALFIEWCSVISENAEESNNHPIFDQLVSAIELKSISAWKAALDNLEELTEKQKRVIELRSLAEVIQPAAPLLYKMVVEKAEAGQDISETQNLSVAWKLARLGAWLRDIQDGVDIDSMQKQLERLTKQEFELNSDLVTLMAWQSQIDRVSKPQRDALMAWSHSMQKYGKGTGKYAHRHLRSAQEALRDAKNAVPVWIMPLNRVAQMFSEPRAGMFDVVIFDEASQCDIKGINVGYLGKKLLVVGDPEQISPAGSFQNQEKIFELISRFLFDIPHKESFLVTSSLFDLAKIRLSNIIQLNEHFRCVPEIIAFSNHHVYEGKLQPLRYPQPKGRLTPALVPIFVENGYQNTNNKSNLPEAEALVDKLVELLNHPDYQKRPNGELCTFGIISLLAEDQAKCISDLIRDRIDEKTIEDRRIVCGDAYAFQGDERDVMLLSMVKASNPDKPDERIMPLTKRDAMQRFNVAASRARDQMFLFHSLPLSSLHNEDDWRLKLLNSFYNPVEEELNAGREALKKEFDNGHASQFSVDVGNILINKGYQVIPEYPVIGYRIDLVVQGTGARLAIECDGDQYHTLENWDNDQGRERQLRRAGWEFWRVTGSSFYRHKENALNSLWEKLDEMGIEPLHKTEASAVTELRQE